MSTRCSWSQVSAFQHYRNLSLTSPLSQSLYTHCCFFPFRGSPQRRASLRVCLVPAAVESCSEIWYWYRYWCDPLGSRRYWVGRLHHGIVDKLCKIWVSRWQIDVTSQTWVSGWSQMIKSHYGGFGVWESIAQCGRVGNHEISDVVCILGICLYILLFCQWHDWWWSVTPFTKMV